MCGPAAQSPEREAAQTDAGAGFYSSLSRLEQDLKMCNQGPALAKGSGQAWGLNQSLE